MMSLAIYYNLALKRFTTVVPVSRPSLKPYPSTPLLGERIHALPWGTAGLPYYFLEVVLSDASPWARAHAHAGSQFIEDINHWMIQERYKHLNGLGVDGVLVRRGIAVELKTGAPQVRWGAQVRRHLQFYSSLAVVCLNPHVLHGQAPAVVVYK